MRRPRGVLEIEEGKLVGQGQCRQNQQLSHRIEQHIALCTATLSFAFLLPAGLEHRRQREGQDPGQEGQQGLCAPSETVEGSVVGGCRILYYEGLSVPCLLTCLLPAPPQHLL
jgi:hypothetical protein